MPARLRMETPSASRFWRTRCTWPTLSWAGINPTVVTELIPAQLNVGQVQRVLQNLLAEGVSIRNLAGILEKVSDHASVTKNPDELSEYARRTLGSQIVKPYQAENGKLQAITLDPRLEQQIAQGM